MDPGNDPASPVDDGSKPTPRDAEDGSAIEPESSSARGGVGAGWWRGMGWECAGFLGTGSRTDQSTRSTAGMASKQQRTIASFFSRAPRDTCAKEAVQEAVQEAEESPTTPSPAPKHVLEDAELATGSRSGRKRKAARRAVIESDSDGEEEEEEYKASSEETDDEDEEEDEYVPAPRPPSSTKGCRTPTNHRNAKAERSKKIRRKSNTPASPSPPAPPTPDADGPGRFARRDESRLDFLQPDKLRDANRRRPDDPAYDPSTLHVPQSFLKSLTGGQEQWWKFKAENFDAVLLFKMGKFYEMFEMDAHVGAEHLGLQYMRGEQPHCGFPEKNYHTHAERLARKGFRVVVIEQTETPEMLAERNKLLGQQGKKKARVVNREKVAVLTKGTLVDSTMVESVTDASYILSVVEALQVTEQGESPQIGLCAVDVATATILVGQLSDDTARSKLQSVLSILRPVELIVPRGEGRQIEGLSPATWKTLRNGSRKPIVNRLGAEEFGASERVLEKIESLGYFSKDGVRFPMLLDSIIGNSDHAISALGGCISYLESVLLDQQIIPNARFCTLPVWEEEAQHTAEDGDTAIQHFVLDAAALENLEVLENSEGGLKGSLLEQLDHCASGPGRRLLREWLVRPLLNHKAIIDRQEAIQDLQGLGDDAACTARKEMSAAPDMERTLARLAAARTGGKGRDSAHVVLYEDVAKRKLVAFVAALQGIESLIRVSQAFDDVRARLKSDRLRRLVTQGSARGLPELSSKLAYFREAFDWEDAKEEGRIIPTQGTNEEYERVVSELQEADAGLEEFMREQRRIFGAGKHEVMYVTVNKDTHRIEVPDKFSKKVPREYQKVGQKKGYCRYTTTTLDALVKARKDKEEKKEQVLSGILQSLLSNFASEMDTWMLATAAAAELDVLISLSLAASYADAPVCVPKFIPYTAGSKPVFNAEQLRHPCGLVGGGAFVPNDICLGGSEPLFMLLTGPNMGGKSTLLRQTCLAVLMAQIGACVPASSLSMTLTDGIYVRMGARDNIMAGQSTFEVELAETASLLRRSTARSIVALDELGRGTATTDGAAIASAVMDHLAKEKRCRVLFSTHFHSLATSHEHCGTKDGDEWVMLRHMGCKITPSQTGVDHIAFLYKLCRGACPKSYGMNVAQLAGVPCSVIQRAVEVSSSFFRSEREEESNQEDKLQEHILTLDPRSASYGELLATWEKVQRLVM